MSASTDPSGPPTRSPTFLDGLERALLRVILVALLLLAGLLGFAWWHAHHQVAATAAATTPGAGPAAPNATTISVLVDFGDGSQRVLQGLAASTGMTVQDAMALARSHPRPILSEVSGSGERAILTSIDSTTSERTRAGRCWQYWINDRYGTVSVGVAALQPGDRVSWAFRPYESDPRPPR